MRTKVRPIIFLFLTFEQADEKGKCPDCPIKVASTRSTEEKKSRHGLGSYQTNKFEESLCPLSATFVIIIMA